MKFEQAKKAFDKLCKARKKIKDFNGISIMYLDTRDEWLVDISNHYFIYPDQVDQFLKELK